MAIAKVKVSQPSPIHELQQNAIPQRAHWTDEEIDIFNEGSKRCDSDKSLSLLMRSEKIATLLDRKSTIDVLERINWNIIERLERCIVQAKASQPSDDLQESAMSQKSSWTDQELQIFQDSFKRFKRDKSLSLLKISENIAGLLDGKSTVDVLEQMKQAYSKQVETAIAKVKGSQPSPIQELQHNAISQRAQWTLEEIHIFDEGCKRFNSDKSLSLLMRSEKIATLLDGKTIIDVLEHIRWSIIENFERYIVQAKASQPSDDLQQSDEDLLALTLGTGRYNKKRKTSDSHLIKKDLEDMQAALAVVSENMKLRLEGAENDRQRVDLVQKNLMQILRNLV